MGILGPNLSGTGYFFAPAYIDVDSGGAPTRGYTISLWFREFADACVGGYPNIAGITNNGDITAAQTNQGGYLGGGYPAAGFQIYDNSGGVMQARVPGNASNVYAAQIPHDGAYHHYVMVYDASTFTLKEYQDGVLKGTNTFSSNLAFRNPPNLLLAILGASSTTSSINQDGALAEVAVWTNPLPAQDIVDLATGKNPLDVQRLYLTSYYPLKNDLRDRSAGRFSLVPSVGMVDPVWTDHPAILSPLARASRRWSYAALRNAGTAPAPTRQPMLWIGM